MSSTERRWSTSSNRSELSKFPDLDVSIGSREHSIIYEDQNAWQSSEEYTTERTPSWPRANGTLHSERWAARRDPHYRWANGHANGSARGHGRQKSLSDAIKTIRSRKGSVSANAQEIAEALKAPISVKLVVLCVMWYLSSALTNTSSKSILNAYPKPITLTIVQFAFVALWCILFAYLAQTFPAVRNAIPALRYGIRPPTKEVISTTLPLALFQLGGHVLSSTATAKIPVSLVHTIKGLSPLFTVLAYRLLFGIHYTVSTYLSLIPLTLGVVLACSVEFSGNIAGVLCAFVAALIFVSQNIFSKKLFNEAARAEADGLPPSQQYPRKLDKLNLLCYCSGLAFLLTFPLWLWTEGFPLFADIYRSGSVSLSNSPTALDHGRLSLEFIFNGAFHFGQNILAFVLLSMVSPVTYSVASLIKRVFVIAISIVWFRNSMSRVQAVGIGLTFLGLYLYDRTHDAARAAKHLHRSQGTPLLPLDTDSRRDGATLTETPTDMNSYGLHTANGHAIGEEKKSDAAGPGRLGPGGWLPPGTKEKDTWRQSSSGNVSRSETAMNYT